MNSAGRSPYDLEIRGLAKTYGAIRAVDGISLEVERGEFLSILGPSGCGKTTTLRMIAGFEQPDAGEIYLQGTQMGTTPPYERNVNTVFQSYALFPHMTVFDNIAFGLRMKRLAREQIARRVKRMLTIVELAGYEQRLPHQLSGGEQQRVGLARALVKEPTVLLLDEPLGALDLKVRKRMQYELKRIHREVGITFIYVTHDQEEALVMSDRIAVMNQGRIEQVDTTFDIYERPQSLFVADFIGESNTFAGEVVATGEDVSVRCGERVVLRGRPVSAALPVGVQVDVVVRPEKIGMGRPETSHAGEENCLRGWVREVVFQGTSVKYVLDIGAGNPLIVHQQNSLSYPQAEFLKPGEEVLALWRLESTLVFPRR
ncbi:MAG: ABC transporter ATP-binding protein [Candidatus Rokubacteria bacterium]|nr:ABC transporter ATP-binding protein [Candidatus Rokubacteria bacterium]